ncbi:MAG TPA: proline racemase family protein [Planctomycetota bacterium]|nr:proline racemase family protein [Planctomycetota bacterium]
MLQFSQVISAVDSHTAGEPTRIVTGGLPLVPGATMVEKRNFLSASCDPVRRALVLEPRGHDAIVLAYLLPPCDARAQLGVVFANDAGYLGMCGHGAIGVATMAVATGLVPAVEPFTSVVLDTPAGVVPCRVAVSGGRPRSVTITNVPSFLSRQRVIVPVHGFGKVAADVAYGGNWFAFVEADQLGLAVEKTHLPVLLQAATAVREALVREGVRGVHPDRGDEEIVDHVKLFADLDGPEHGSRAMTLCPGTAYDRSPCGTGTSARLAVLHAKGELQTGEWYVSESVLGTRFRARVAGETKVGAMRAIVPEIEGSAWITGFSTFVIDPEDPCRFGI